MGCSDFARRYFRNHGCFLFLWVLRWFTSPGLPPAPMNSGQDKPCSHGLGSPIRTSPDHDLFAAPRGLSQLTTSFFAFLRQGIHTHALSSLTIKFTLATEHYYLMVALWQLAVARQYSIFKDRDRWRSAICGGRARAGLARPLQISERWWA